MRILCAGVRKERGWFRPSCPTSHLRYGKKEKLLFSSFNRVTPVPVPRSRKRNPCALWVKVCACLAADHSDASAACASVPLRSCQRGFKRHSFRISREVGEDESPADNPPASPPAPGETSPRLTPNFYPSFENITHFPPSWDSMCSPYRLIIFVFCFLSRSCRMTTQ